MSWSFTGAPPNEGNHADPLDAPGSVLADILVGTQGALRGTSPLGGYRSYTRPF